MHIIGYIVQGDRTSHGGQVLECHARRSINGMRLARVGDPVWCPRCKRMTQIVTSRYPQVTDDNIAAAFHLDLTDCGAQLYSRFNDYAGYGTGAAVGNSAKSTAASGDPARAADLQEHFILHGQASGAKLAGLAYTVHTAEGGAFDGKTDEEGRTSVVWTAAPSDLKIVLRAWTDRSDDPYHFPESPFEER